MGVAAIAPVPNGQLVVPMALRAVAAVPTRLYRESGVEPQAREACGRRGGADAAWSRPQLTATRAVLHAPAAIDALAFVLAALQGLRPVPENVVPGAVVAAVETTAGSLGSSRPAPTWLEHAAPAGGSRQRSRAFDGLRPELASSVLMVLYAPATGRDPAKRQALGEGPCARNLVVVIGIISGRQLAARPALPSVNGTEVGNER
mmetsp:Transcript_26288/g.66192  ORF Transcript_26288/g.66192 Transcript_26288/m.66192 type:complete len:204 (-) Transcript_26288:1237-1848(-)